MVKQGDIIYVNFNPRKGHEQKGERPAIVVSNNIFNKMNNLKLVCPITSSEPKNPLKVPLIGKIKTTGTILCDQVKSLDINARKYRVVEKIPKELLSEVLDVLQSIID